ncbi:MAG: Fis family transcriptional regulator [Acidobacteria bacterium]|nr:MAG: Fis family transcriptional regulator [Acidobacteriota bacterium]
MLRAEPFFTFFWERSSAMKILLIEDEKITRITLSNTLRKEGYEVTPCGDGTEALKLVQGASFDVILTDLRLPGASGLSILKTAKEHHPKTEVILMTAYATVDTAVEALKNGAYDYMTKPFSPESLLVRLGNLEKIHKFENENQTLRARIMSFEKRLIIGESVQTRKLLELIDLVADRDTSILIEGESGTGKELVARALHNQSSRRKQPFIAVNCAAIPESLFESELFGHEKGSFSGAHRQHIGYFERADGGSLFIDDIDDFPLALQVKLLRVLQERQVQRIGGKKPVPIHIRLIAASKISLWEMVQKKTFREDLFYRLNIVPIHVTPLRERISDIPLLVDHFLEKHGGNEIARQKSVALLPRLTKYHWPGNIRQLENLMQRIIALPELPLDEQLPGERNALNEPTPNPLKAVEESYPSYKQFMEHKDLEIITWAMKKANGNTSLAAKTLDLPRSTLRSKLKKYNLYDSELKR